MKSILLPILVISLSLQAQKVENYKQKGSFSFQPSLELSRFNFVDFGYGGQGPNYSQFKSQFRYELKATLIYNSKWINGGVGGSIVGLGEKVSASSIRQFFPFNSLYFRARFNMNNLMGSTDYHFGPFVEIAKLRNSRDSYFINFSYKLGIEYQINELCVALNYGFFSPNGEGKSILAKNEISVNKHIYQIGFEVGYNLNFKKTSKEPKLE